jgi:hypothetical protein
MIIRVDLLANLAVLIVAGQDKSTLAPFPTLLP